MRATALFIFAFSAVASASAILPRDDCNTGGTQCCNTLQSVNAPGVTQILGGLSLLGLPIDVHAVLGATNTLIGLACTPLSVLGAGGNSCSSQPVCCTNNYSGGILSTGCLPININP